jgi:outer membrane protein assembly factor BamB
VWTQAWAKAYESYNNTHLRGVAIRGKTLLAEVYQQGYEFRLYREDGTPLWERPGGERALLSPDGTQLVWQNEFDETRLSSVHDKAERWKRKNEALVRLKAVDDRGRVLLVEGRRLSVLDAGGKLLWEDFFKEDPGSLALGSGGRLLVIKGDKAGLLKVPFDV